MTKKATGTDWAKGGIINLSKSMDNNTEKTAIQEKASIKEKTQSAENAVDMTKKHRLTIDLTEGDFRKLRLMAAYHGKSIVAYIRDVVINGDGK